MPVDLEALSWWLRFAALQLQPRVSAALLERYGTPQALFEARADELQDALDISGRQAPRLNDPDLLPTKRQLEFAQREGVSVLHARSPGFPVRLTEMDDPPTALFLRGELAEQDRFAVAIVGSRYATAYGRTVTTKLAGELARAGLTIVSGGARGIDATAHRAALEAGGRTIVVLGCGLDITYPQENQKLFAEIVQRGRGAIISEFPLGTKPEPFRFPQRNRIVSALSLGVLVVEAGAKSGALLTAQKAAEQGREVMAVPGNIDRVSSVGCNALIRDGAALVVSARDVCAILGILALQAQDPATTRSALSGLSAEQRRLIEGLDLVPRSLDNIAIQVGVSTAELAAQLTLLELAGIVRREPGNSWVRQL